MDTETQPRFRARRLALLLACWSAAPLVPANAGNGLELPWREAGLNERQAAAHLLDRLTYGARPGEVDRVVGIGLEQWVDRQLAGNAASPKLARYLGDFETLDLSNREIVEKYPPPGLVLMEARQAGVVEFDPEAPGEDRDRPGRRRALMQWAREQGYGSPRQLLGELVAQKLYRAIYSENQLHEILSDFWFNHFNVSSTDNQARPFIGTYERDAIRPYVLGDFRDLVGATARHPAMLYYLDNVQSTANEGQRTLMDERTEVFRGRRGRGSGGAIRMGGTRRRNPGLNENYARELLELHTLGVDGGYTQEDVIEVARAFTGWSVMPPRVLRDQVGEEQIRRAFQFGMLEEGEGGFLFRVAEHDAERKKVLGHVLPPGRGLEDGEQVLDIVAGHPATARQVSLKLARRFVSDEPPPALVTRMAGTFRETDGNLESVMRTLLSSPEFWDTEARGQKIKSPLELVASSLRALDADVWQPRQTVQWIERMGQPLYAYQAPTGYPDRASHWVNTGALLSRMNYGLALAGGQVRGVDFDLDALNGGREPESMEAALETYSELLMPERDLEASLELLEPMLFEPRLAQRVADAAPPETDASAAAGMEDPVFPDDEEGIVRPVGQGKAPQAQLAHVVGIILGSPEFQRR